jgi:hypothetical protein
MDAREEHEQGLAMFITSEWRGRFRDSLATSKRREKLRRQLPHFRHLDARFATSVATNEQSSSKLGPRLRAAGAGDHCYLLSESSEYDGLEMALDEALVEIVDGGSFSATFISCVPGRVAYFHDETPSTRYLLVHPG